MQATHPGDFMAGHELQLCESIGDQITMQLQRMTRNLMHILH
jgi:hypothetical protein